MKYYNDTYGLLRTSCSRNPEPNDTYGLLRTSCSRNPEPNDTYGLLRTLCSRNPTQYSHIARLSSRFYANIGAGPKVLYPHLSKLNVGKDFGTLVSLYTPKYQMKTGNSGILCNSSVAPFAKSRFQRFPAASQLSLLISWRSSHNLCTRCVYASITHLVHRLWLNCYNIK